MSLRAFRLRGGCPSRIPHLAHTFSVLARLAYPPLTRVVSDHPQQTLAMEATAYLVCPLHGCEDVGVVGVSVSDSLQILEAMEESGANPTPIVVAAESEIRFLSFDDFPEPLWPTVFLSPSIALLTSEMPVPLPGPRAAIRRVSARTVSWHGPADEFGTQDITEFDVLLAACVSARPGDDVTLPFQRLAALDPTAALGLAAGTYDRPDLNLPRLGCGALGPRCLEPLLSHEDRDIREQAIGLLSRFKY